ncbi:carotenoid biosynthesis protein [Actinocorallia aurea]
MVGEPGAAAMSAGRAAASRANAAGAVLLAAMVAAQVATGIAEPSGEGVAAVVALLAGCALAFTAASAGWPRALGAFGAAGAVGFAAEWIGTRTGLPFGDYAYGDVLGGKILGVPAAVVAAWAGMGLAAYAVAPGEGWKRIAAGAAALTAWDLFLDPQMVRLGAWSWADGGPYRGVPLSNFAGWLLVSAVVMAVLDRTGARRAAGATGLLALYTAMAVMETVGFTAVFRPPDRLVAILGGVAMGVFAVCAWRARARGKGRLDG